MPNLWVIIQHKTNTIIFIEKNLNKLKQIEALEIEIRTYMEEKNIFII